MLTAEKELALKESVLRTSSASPCNSDLTSSESEDSDTERTEGLEPPSPTNFQDSPDSLETSERFQDEGLAFLDCNVADIMEELDFPDADESDSGGSDSHPSDDNLEDLKLRQVEEKLMSRRKPVRSTSKRKVKSEKNTSNTLNASKKLTKVPSRKEMPSASSGARQRAKSFGRKEKDEESKEKAVERVERVERVKEPARPRDVVVRPPVEKVVAFGQTTYLVGRQRGGSCMPRLQEKEVKGDPLEAVSKDRLDRLGRRGMAAAMSTLTANPRVQLAAACVLGKLETQEPLSPKSPQNRSHPSLQSLQSDSPRRERDTDGRDGRDGRDVSLHTFLERYERDEDDTRKPRPKTAALYRGKTTEMEPKVSTKTTRAESEHGRRCTGQRWTKWDGPCVQLDKDVPLDEMSLSPSRTVRSRGARPFSFQPPVAAPGDKIAIAALRSWATAATVLAKANFEETVETKAVEQLERKNGTNGTTGTNATEGKKPIANDV